MIYLVIVLYFISDTMLPGGLGPLKQIQSLVPDLTSGLLFVYVLLYAAYTKRVYIGMKYVYIFILLMLLFLVSIIDKQVNAGAVFSAMRVYLNFVPIFLLPMVVIHDDKKIEKIALFILVLVLLQTPIALLQKFVIFPREKSGDVVRGTLVSSGLLSIFQLCAISFLTTYFYHKKITLKTYLWLTFTVFLPTTINETKATVMLLPLTLLVPALVNQEIRRKNKKLIIGMAAMSVLLIGAFGVVYNLYWQKTGGGIVGWYTEGRFFRGLSKESEVGKDVAMGYDTSRWDSIMLAVRGLSASDPIHLLVGFGPGNVAFTGAKVLRGEYASTSMDVGIRVTTVGYLIWEIGLIGVALIFIFLITILNDAIKLCRAPGFNGLLAQGTATVIVLLMVSMFYKFLIAANTIGVPFWYACGLIVRKLYSGEAYANAERVA